MSFVVGGISSDPVVIDVTGTLTMTYAPTSNYFPPTINYPGSYSPYSYVGLQAALDLADVNKANQKAYSNYWNYGINPMLNAT